MNAQSIFLLSPKMKDRIHISGVTKCLTKFLTLSKSVHCDSVKNFVTHFVTPEIWILSPNVSMSRDIAKDHGLPLSGSMKYEQYAEVSLRLICPKKCAP